MRSMLGEAGIFEKKGGQKTTVSGPDQPLANQPTYAGAASSLNHHGNMLNHASRANQLPVLQPNWSGEFYGDGGRRMGRSKSPSKK